MWQPLCQYRCQAYHAVVTCGNFTCSCHWYYYWNSQSRVPRSGPWGLAPSCQQDCTEYAECLVFQSCRQCLELCPFLVFEGMIARCINFWLLTVTSNKSYLRAQCKSTCLKAEGRILGKEVMRWFIDRSTWLSVNRDWVLHNFPASSRP